MLRQDHGKFKASLRITGQGQGQSEQQFGKTLSPSKNQKEGWGYSLEIEHLPSMCETLDPVPKTMKTIKIESYKTITVNQA